MAAKNVTIPVSAVFEKRLAELVWDNCPELARQTAAGQMALSLDYGDKAIQRMVMERLMFEVLETLRPKVLAALESEMEETLGRVDGLVKEALKEVMPNVETMLRLRAENGFPAFENEMGKRSGKIIHEVLEGRATRAVDEYFDGRNGPFAKRVIASRMDAMLASRIEERSTKDAE